MFRRLKVNRPLAFIDIESTGVDPKTDRLVEIAILRFAPESKVISITRRVNPGLPIPSSATAVHGIADADVATCPTFREISHRLIRVLDGSDLAGFNIKKFDLPLLVAEFCRAGVHFPLVGRAVIDAMQLFHLRERRDLAAAYAFYCGKQHENAHRAEQDVWATAMVLDAQLSRYRDLPRTAAELHHQLTEVDLGGWFRLRAGQLVFGIGKHAGRLLSEVVERHPDYVRWLLSLDLLEDTRRVLETAIGTQSEQ